MAAPVPVIVGVDVGGTNTDAVVVTKVTGEGHRILAEDKHLTTSDVTKGVRNAVLSVLRQASKGGQQASQSIVVKQINIGTTHFVNAVIQAKHLNRVSVVRLCGTASRALPPFSDFPPRLRDVICGSTHLVNGGYRVDGKLIEEVDEKEMRAVVEEIKKKGVKGIVVCGVFSPTRIEQEEKVKQMILDLYPEASITLSHTIGHIGLLERENAAILNEALKDLCQRTVSGFRKALQDIGLTCPMFLTQNDGTVISEQQALDTPVFTFASGPTNSMRGAAFLCQLTDAVVVDIGGTTTDVGVLKKRFPRQASTDVRVGGVRTNFHMPDVHSVGLGGGSYVTKTAKGKTCVGPLSAGYNLKEEALVFGTVADNSDPENSSRRLTATDVAVAAGLMDLGDRSMVSGLPLADVEAAMRRMRKMVEDAIDSVRVSEEPLPVILVGGGSKLLDTKAKMAGVSQIYLPEHYGVANAIGAALSQVSGSMDCVVSLEKFLDAEDLERRTQRAKSDLPPDATQEQTDEAVNAVRKPLLEAARDQAVREITDSARQMALKAGADPATLHVVDMEEVALAYLPGSATRIKIKIVGDLLDSPTSKTTTTTEQQTTTTSNAPWKEPAGVDMLQTDLKTDVAKQLRSITGETLDPIAPAAAESAADSNSGVTWAGLTPTRPQVDPVTGEWVVGAWDVECLAVGAGLLGAGGGGSPHVGRVRARAAVDSGQRMVILSPERLISQTDPSDLLVCVGFMGAPLVVHEQLCSGQEIPDAIRCVQDLFAIGGYADGQLKNKEGVEIKEEGGVVYIDDYQPIKSLHAGSGEKSAGPDFGGRKVVGVLCGEVGGLNAIEPLLVSAMLGLPLVDADCMGRAFPMLQMFLPFIKGEKPCPAAVVDDKGQRAVILKAETARHVEDHFRGVAIQMGSCAGLALAALENHVIMEKTVIRSFSRAWTIGDSILRARQKKENPVQALSKVEDLKVLVVGKICDVTRETSGGFNKGRVRIEGTEYDPQGIEGEGEETVDGGGGVDLLRVVLDFQNENLVARRVNETGAQQAVLATVPDIIVIVDSETVEPIPTEEVRYGQRVMVLVLPAPSSITSPQALGVLGPAAFSYSDVEYTPLGQYREAQPLAPL